MKGIIEIFIDVIKWVFVVAVSSRALHYLENTAEDTYRQAMKIEQYVKTHERIPNGDAVLKIKNRIRAFRDELLETGTTEANMAKYMVLGEVLEMIDEEGADNG